MNTSKCGSGISRLLAQRDIPRPCAPPCKLALIDDAGHCVPVTYVVFQVCKAARPFCKLDSNAGSVLLRNSPDRAIMLASAHAMVRPPAAIFANCGVKKRVASGEKSLIFRDDKVPDDLTQRFDPAAQRPHCDLKTAPFEPCRAFASRLHGCSTCVDR